MTNEELKDEIDLTITSETTPASITPTDVGDTLKLIVDYVDQECVTKTIKVTLSSADILSLFTTPKELLPAVAGKMYIPRHVFQKLDFGTVAYTYSGNVRLAYNTASNWVAQFVPFITANDNGESITALNINGATVTGNTYSGKSLLLTAISSDPTGGDGSLDVYLNYYEITL